MTREELLKKYQTEYDVIGVVNLEEWYNHTFFKREPWLRKTIESYHRESFNDNQRLIFILGCKDEYESYNDQCGLILKTLQKLLNWIDISNYFVILLTNDPDAIKQSRIYLEKNSSDPVPMTYDFFQPFLTGEKQLVKSQKSYQYDSPEPNNISLDELSDKHKHLLSSSKSFCMYPWIHLHAYPTGEAWPCCMADMNAGPVGNCKQQTLKEIWNGDRMKKLRSNLLNDRPDSLCVKCYEREDSGFFSGRKSANKHHGHHIFKVDETREDGHYEKFEMVYWDIRFSNLCNLSCRSCGHIFSSSWYQDQAKLAGPEWAKNNRVLNYAGKFETDVWEQLVEHIDHVEQIYFAGGEPLLMDEHYRILDELEKREKFNVRLIYNTNFTHVKLKDRLVFDYWKKFDSVSVGASLDAMGPRAEYIRKGTHWDQVERNREKMLEICPRVDFYISPTLSIMNAWHLPDFHREWVNKGLIRHQDLNVNILQDPIHYRLDIAPMKYKQRLRMKFQEHIDWLHPHDELRRAIVGFESAINFMMSTDNTHLIDTFWRKTHELDAIRNENILEVIPELEALK